MAGIPERFVPLSVLVASLVSLACQGKTPEAVDTPPCTVLLDEIDISPYAGVLAAYVDGEGLVDYAALKSDARLDAFLAQLNCLDPAVYAGWDDAHQIAFWLNTYNAYTLKAIVDHYPIEAGGFSALTHPANSIRQIDGVWTKLTWPVMGKSVTLDAMEHDMLRKEFPEPRIHAALVCAAVSCPPLRNEPFSGGKLDEQLDGQMRHWLRQEGKFRVDKDAGVVYLSRIFDWYGGDFVADYGEDAIAEHDKPVGAVLNAVSRYVDEDTADYLRTGTYSVDYLDYDWTLNEQ